MTTVGEIKVGQYYKLGSTVYQRIDDGPWKGVDVRTGQKINPALGKKVEAYTPAVAPTSDSATDRQISYLIDLGVYIPQNASLTKATASMLIDLAKHHDELDGTGYRYAADMGL